MAEFVSVSIIIVSKNDSKNLEACLWHLNKQDYPKSQIEILVIDGGSTDNSRLVAKKFNANFIDGGYSNNQEARRYIGYQLAKNKILLYLDTDNFLVMQNVLKSILKVFDDSEVACSFTRWYGYTRKLNLVDRYFALLGGNDPVAYYLGKNDRCSYGEFNLPRGATLIKQAHGVDYVKFDIENLPTIGCNGFAVRKTVFDKLELKSPLNFYHTDVHVDLISKNPNLIYAIVGSEIVHASGLSLMRCIKKRISYKSIHSNDFSKFRRYKVFNKDKKEDIVRLIFVNMLVLTVAPLILFSIYKIIRTGKYEWIMHSLMTTGMVFGYSISIVKNFFNKLRSNK